jgi:hypothetical protein
MLPPKRLESLLSQAVELQQERCTYHVKPGKLTLDDVSLLKDHACTKYVLCFRTKLLQLSMLTSAFTSINFVKIGTLYNGDGCGCEVAVVR